MELSWHPAGPALRVNCCLLLGPTVRLATSRGQGRHTAQGAEDALSNICELIQPQGLPSPLPAFLFKGSPGEGKGSCHVLTAHGWARHAMLYGICSPRAHNSSTMIPILQMRRQRLREVR